MYTATVGIPLLSCCSHIGRGHSVFSQPLSYSPRLSFLCPQCGRGEAPHDPLRVRELVRDGQELPAHAGGSGLQFGDVRLPLRQAELQPDFPQLAALRSVSEIHK